MPVKDGVLGDDTRIRASLTSIEAALKAGAGVIVMSHLGRPSEGEIKAEDRLEPVAKRMGELLGRDIQVLDSWEGYQVKPGELVMLQNVRCNVGEKKKTAKNWARNTPRCAMCLCTMRLVLRIAPRPQPTPWPNLRRWRAPAF